MNTAIILETGKWENIEIISIYIQNKLLGNQMVDGRNYLFIKVPQLANEKEITNLQNTPTTKQNKTHVLTD